MTALGHGENGDRGPGLERPCDDEDPDEEGGLTIGWWTSGWCDDRNEDGGLGGVTEPSCTIVRGSDLVGDTGTEVDRQAKCIHGIKNANVHFSVAIQLESTELTFPRAHGCSWCGLMM